MATRSHVLCSHHNPLCCLSPVVATSYCCLASVCLLAVDSLLGKHLSLILAKPPCTRVLQRDKCQKGRRQRPREARAVLKLEGAQLMSGVL